MAYLLQKLIRRAACLSKPDAATRENVRSDPGPGPDPEPQLRPPRLPSPASAFAPRGPDLVSMADQEEDFSSLPLTDRWVHKVFGLATPRPQAILS